MAASSNLSTLDVSNAIERLNVEETRELFFQLKIPLKAMDDIASQYHDAENRKQHFVQKWLDMNEDASWAKLVAGLRRINMNSLATEIESAHLSRVPSSGSVSLVPSSALSPLPEARPPAHLETASVSATPAGHPNPSPPYLTPSPSPSSFQITASFRQRVEVARASIEHLEEDYSNIRFDTQESLLERESEDKKFVRRFKDYLLGLPVTKKQVHIRFFARNNDEILAADTIKKLFSILRRHGNYTNYEVILHIVKRFCNEELKQRMLSYRDSLTAFEKTTTVDVYLHAISARPDGAISIAVVKMTMRLNKAPSECTLHEIRELNESIRELKVSITKVSGNYLPVGADVVEDSEEMVQKRIDKAMKSGSLQQRNVVGVITGLMGSGKTTLLYRLFGEPPPDLYTSTGVAEQSFRGLLHYTVHLSAGTWQRLSHEDICHKLLAPLIKAGMSEADVHALVSRLMHNVNPTSVPTNPLYPEPSSTSASASVPSEEDASLSPTKPTSLPGKSPTCQEMVSHVKSVAPTLEDLVLEMVHMIDTGGQPELIEIMPSVIHNADLAIALLNLEYSLSEQQQVDYHEKGEAYRRKTPFMVSGRDIILKLASTLHGKKSLHEPFRLLIVATHRDCVKGDLEARVETLNRELRSLLLPAFENELLFSKGRNKIAYVLDLKNPDDSDKRALELIRREVGEPDLGKTFETPISFFVFEQDLLKFAESVVRRDILSLDECKVVGAQLEMSQETVVAALVLFNRQNTFLYFHNVLPNHVFIKPQVPLDIVNSIVAFSYKELEGVPAKLVSQLENGIITEKLLSYYCRSLLSGGEERSGHQISPHFQTGVYEVQDAIRLFCHTLTIAPLHHKEGAAHPIPKREREYLMMCLKPPIPDQELHRYIPKSSDMVPLVVRFSSGCVPLGCFGSTISCLLSKYRWEVIEGEDGTPKCLAHNIASLHDPQLLVDILLVDFTQYLQVHVSCDPGIHQLPPNTCSLVLTNVFGAIEKVFEIMRLGGDKMGITPAVLCSCTKVKEKHFANFERRDSKYFLRCSQTTSIPDQKHMLWMGNETAHTKPTLPQLIRLKIPEKVGGNYRNFGTFLLDDDTGSLVDIAEKSCHYQPDDIVTSILRKWLKEGPTPVTWDNLIQVLRDCGLQRVADYVRDSHREVIFNK